MFWSKFHSLPHQRRPCCSMFCRSVRLRGRIPVEGVTSMHNTLCWSKSKVITIKSTLLRCEAFIRNLLMLHHLLWTFLKDYLMLLQLLDVFWHQFLRHYSFKLLIQNDSVDRRSNSLEENRIQYSRSLEINVFQPGCVCVRSGRMPLWQYVISFHNAVREHWSTSPSPWMQTNRPAGSRSFGLCSVIACALLLQSTMAERSKREAALSCLLGGNAYDALVIRCLSSGQLLPPLMCLHVLIFPFTSWWKWTKGRSKSLAGWHLNAIA